jgi:hypothetical protein
MEEVIGKRMFLNSAAGKFPDTINEILHQGGYVDETSRILFALGTGQR